MKRISFLDSHTGGEPTRLIEDVSSLDLGSGSVADKLSRLKSNHDTFRSQVLNEPRGSEVLVGALLVSPSDSSCQFGVIFFNNVGYLGMCGHGTIGVIASLSYLGRINPGSYKIETPVGLLKRHCIHRKAVIRTESPVRNIPAYRYLKQVAVEIDGRTIHGDVAWGGNWFFLVHDHGLNVNLQNIDQLTDFAWRVREAYTRMGIVGADGHEVDHVELFTDTPDADSKSFVLCPGKAYDRSPCGTGTSAKLACLSSDGKLAEGQIWKQQSVVGSIFEGQIQIQNGSILPMITGEAWVMGEGELLIDERDPFKDGIRI